MISRRNFGKFLVAGSGLTASRFASANENIESPATKEILIGGARYTEGDTGEEKFVLSLAQTGTTTPDLIPTDFFPHGISIKPSHPYHVLVMEKKGPGCALVDIKSKEVMLNVSASNGCWFYGHGAYSKDSAQIYLVETDLSTNRGLLSIRDAETSKIIGEIDTYGANPHDCLLIEDGNYLAITNAGLGKNSSEKDARPCVTYVDPNTGQLLEKIPLTNTDINAGHLLITNNSDLAVVSAPRDDLPPNALGGISLKPNDERMETLSAPNEILDQLAGETLSLAYHVQTDTLAATTPDANLITFWKMSSRSFISAVRLPNARGICLNTDQTHFLVSARETPSLYRIDAKDQSNVELIHSNSYISGSHLYNWTSLSQS